MRKLLIESMIKEAGRWTAYTSLSILLCQFLSALDVFQLSEKVKSALWKVLLLELVIGLVLFVSNRVFYSYFRKFVIHSASYGRGNDRFDVTEAVLKHLADGRLAVESGNQLGGDPHEGANKVLTVDYSVGKKRKQAVVPEGGVLILP